MFKNSLQNTRLFTSVQSDSREKYFTESIFVMFLYRSPFVVKTCLIVMLAYKRKQRTLSIDYHLSDKGKQIKEKKERSVSVVHYFLQDFHERERGGRLK